MRMILWRSGTGGDVGLNAEKYVMRVDWNFVFTAVSAISTSVAAIFSAVSARASMMAAKTLTEPKPELTDERLRVPFAAIRKDTEGYFVSGYGRLQIEQTEYKQHKKGGGKILLVCVNGASSDSKSSCWIPVTREPL
jgi:hypothetical protein